jgi:hypothetical protein
MAGYCAKHDKVFPEGQTCEWCDKEGQATTQEPTPEPHSEPEQSNVLTVPSAEGSDTAEQNADETNMQEGTRKRKRA